MFELRRLLTISATLLLLLVWSVSPGVPPLRFALSLTAVVLLCTVVLLSVPFRLLRTHQAAAPR